MKELSNVIESLHQRQANIKFQELVKICNRWFGAPRTSSGSHKVYSMPWPGDPRVNIQRADSGMAKVYQVRQVIAALVRLEAEHGNT
ncbi:toxin HicA [Serratia sp. S1B]|nr:toxin HicA [Serratia sp. S1B]